MTAARAPQVLQRPSRTRPRTVTESASARLRALGTLPARSSATMRFVLRDRFRGIVHYEVNSPAIPAHGKADIGLVGRLVVGVDGDGFFLRRHGSLGIRRKTTPLPD